MAKALMDKDIGQNEFDTMVETAKMLIIPNLNK
jgi:hypothetical protein